ncbi:MAG TPA: hypothetical protein VGV68_02065 [Terriglobia bacterium]|nr:hypothetical protein [Terriglobia bacterium]
MHFDTALNLAWVFVGVVALGALGVSELRRGAATMRSRCRRGIAVLVATVALFPCISASDDLVSLEQLQIGSANRAAFTHGQSQESNQQPDLFLALQFESLENFQISSACFCLVPISKFARVRPRAARCFERPLPSRTDRAPPQQAFLA